MSDDLKKQNPDSEGPINLTDSIDQERGAMKDDHPSSTNAPLMRRALIICMGLALVFMIIPLKLLFKKNAGADQKSSTQRKIENTLPNIDVEGIGRAEDKLLKTDRNRDFKKYDDIFEEKDSSASMMDAVIARQLSSGLIDSDSSQQIQNTPRQNAVTDEGSSDSASTSNSTLEMKLQPVVLQAQKAGQLKNRSMLITQGTMIDCQLETMLISTQPGMTACYTTRDIYSSDGKVVLIDKGSKVIGHYSGALRQGQARIFVAWDRLETPQGVVVNLASLGTGPLGEAGIGGWIDYHFKERFGGAILVSLIGDVGDYLSNLAGRSEKQTIQFNNTSEGAQQAATEVLKQSLQITPTLYKNIGERVNIFVSRDLDFSNVYRLKAVR